MFVNHNPNSYKLIIEYKMKKVFTLMLGLTILSSYTFSQKVMVSTSPSDATIYLNSVKTGNPKKVNSSDPKIGLVAVKKGYATTSLSPRDIKGESSYTMEMIKISKPSSDYESKKIEFTQIEDRTGKVEKESVPTGWYGTTTTATDLDNAQFKGAITSMFQEWGYQLTGGSDMFKNAKTNPQFAVAGELIWFTKDTRGSGYQITIFVKWSVYSYETESIVLTKTTGGYSDSRSTSKFNDELVFTIEDALAGLIGDEQFSSLVGMY